MTHYVFQGEKLPSDFEARVFYTEIGDAVILRILGSKEGVDDVVAYVEELYSKGDYDLCAITDCIYVGVGTRELADGSEQEIDVYQLVVAHLREAKEEHVV